MLLSIFFAAVGVALADGENIPGALQAGVERMQHCGGAQRGDRTMLDALPPAIDTLAAGHGLTSAAQADELVTIADHSNGVRGVTAHRVSAPEEKPGIIRCPSMASASDLE